MNILVIEDEKKVATFIKRSLESDGYAVTLSHDCASGLIQANSEKYDLIIIDRGLPEKDGLTVICELREAGNQVPVLMLTAKSEIEDIVIALETGADDYLRKLFEFTELKARMMALIRRGEQKLGAFIRYADLCIDPVNHRVWRGDTELALSQTEYRMLTYFVRNATKVVSRQNIADNCWDLPLKTFSNIVDVYINYLRNTVDAPFPTRLIHTIRDQGYVLELMPR